MSLGYQNTICQKLKLFEIGSIVQYKSGFDDGVGGWVSYGSYGVILKTIMTIDEAACTAKVYWFDDEDYSYVCGSQLKFIC